MISTSISAKPIKTTEFSGRYHGVAGIPKLCTPEEASKFTYIPVKQLLELAETGYAPHIRIAGGEIFFFRLDLLAWVKEYLVEEFPSAALDPFVVIQEAPDLEDLPVPLTGISNIRKLMDQSACGVYFLCQGDEVVYVGQSINCHARVTTHRSQKRFDRAFYVPVPKSSLDRIEVQFIAALKPKLNGNPGPVLSAKGDVVHYMKKPPPDDSDGGF